jgi:hypothetical protein
MTAPEIDTPFALLDVIEHASGRLLFKASLRRKSGGGKVKEEPCRVCVPTPDDSVNARIGAAMFFKKNPALDRKVDADLFEQVEQMELLAIAIRADDGVDYPQMMDRAELAKYDEASLHDIQERINIYKLLVDCRASELSQEQVIRTTLSMHRGKTIAPLADMAGPAQLSYLLGLVGLAVSSPAVLSYLRASESSTPEP